MIFEFQAALIMYAIVNTCCAAFIAFLWYFHRKRFASVWYWVAYMTLLAAASILIALRNILSGIFSIIIANSLVAIGLLFILIGLERFLGKKNLNIHNYVLVTFFIGIHVYFTYFQPNILARVYNVAAIMLVLIFQCAWLLLRRAPQDMKQFTRILGTVFGFYFFIILVRGGVSTLFPLGSKDFLKSGIADILLIIFYSIITIWITFGLILLVNGRLAKDRIESEKMLQEHSKDLERIVAELKKRTKELKVAQGELIRKEKMAVLGQLAGGVAHDLRNPLTTIKNAAYFLNMAIEKPEPDIKKALEVLDKATVNSEEIISNILEFGRSRHPIKKKVDIGNILKDIITQTTIPDNIEVLNNIDKDIPNITADPGQITRAFSNIILNAIQAMPDGGELSLKYTITGKKWLEISISDTGSGILQENIDKVFEPLFTTKAKGIGLGMAITKTLVEAHGGSIRIKSKVGDGATFIVSLPIEDK